MAQPNSNARVYMSLLTRDLNVTHSEQLQSILRVLVVVGDSKEFALESLDVGQLY